MDMKVSILKCDFNNAFVMCTIAIGEGVGGSWKEKTFSVITVLGPSSENFSGLL